MSGPDPGGSSDDGNGDDGDRRDAPPDGNGGSTTADDGASRTNDEPARDDPDEGDAGATEDEPTVGASRGDANEASDDEGSWDGPRRDGGVDSSAEDATDDVTIADDGVVRWFLKTDDESVVFARDVLSSVAIVAVIGLILFGISGIWPPLVAVESGSMEPNMQEGDLIFVVDDDRFVGDGATDGTGVVTLEDGQESDHDKFGEYGDVIVFHPDGDERQTPVIHRAHFWVEEGENWVDTRADDEYVGDATCDDLRSCPADRDGFVTMGDANGGYDQHPARGADTNSVVSPDWITGKAMVRVPWLGNVRLAFDAIFGAAAPMTPSIGEPVTAATGGSGSAAVQVGTAGAAGVSVAGLGVGFAANRFRHRR